VSNAKCNPHCNPIEYVQMFIFEMVLMKLFSIHSYTGHNQQHALWGPNIFNQTFSTTQANQFQW
jgi:hypothetical protein